MQKALIMTRRPAAAWRLFTAHMTSSEEELHLQWELSQHIKEGLCGSGYQSGWDDPEVVWNPLTNSQNIEYSEICRYVEKILGKKTHIHLPEVCKNYLLVMIWKWLVNIHIYVFISICICLFIYGSMVFSYIWKSISSHWGSNCVPFVVRPEH